MSKFAREEAAWRAALQSGDPTRIAITARKLTEAKSKVDTSFRFTVCDKLWTPMGSIGNELMEASGADPWNDCPTARITHKGNSPLTQMFMDCRDTMVGIEVETAGERMNFYVKSHDYDYKNGEWTGTVEARGIWDILNYYVIWPSWWLPIQAQPFSHAIFIWALQTVLENMVAECAMRIQSGWLEFINNGLSLNTDVRAWFGTILQALERDGLSLQTFGRMLKTPTYVQRTNPFLDTSPMAARTVRMETVGTVIKDITRAYGVSTDMVLWRPGDPQPDKWANLDQPTYVFSTKDRSQITGPFGNVLDSVLRTVVDLGGSLGGIFKPVVQQVPGMDGVFYAPGVGVDFEQPYAYLVAPEKGEDSSIIECKIRNQTPEGWQHIIGGRSPKWVCAPWGNLGGTGPRAFMTQRFDERDVRLADRFPDDRGGIHGHPKRSAFRVPEQQLLGVPVDAALRPARRGRPVPSGGRTVPRHRISSVQHRDRVRVHQRPFRFAGLHHRASLVPQRRPVRLGP